MLPSGKHKTAECFRGVARPVSRRSGAVVEWSEITSEKDLVEYYQERVSGESVEMETIVLSREDMAELTSPVGGILKSLVEGAPDIAAEVMILEGKKPGEFWMFMGVDPKEPGRRFTEYVRRNARTEREYHLVDRCEYLAKLVGLVRKKKVVCRRA